jgi:hypothetical protein
MDSSGLRKVPRYHDMKRPQVAMGGDDVKIRRIGTNILNKCSCKADKS